MRLLMTQYSKYDKTCTSYPHVYTPHSNKIMIQSATKAIITNNIHFNFLHLPSQKKQKKIKVDKRDNSTGQLSVY